MASRLKTRKRRLEDDDEDWQEPKSVARGIAKGHGKDDRNGGGGSAAAGGGGGDDPTEEAVGQEAVSASDAALAASLMLPERVRRHRVAKATAVVAIRETVALQRQWATEVFMSELEDAQRAFVRVATAAAAADVAAVAAVAAVAPSGAVTSSMTCSCCMFSVEDVVQPCKADASIRVCQDCLTSMVAALVNDAVANGTPLPPQGTCMIHHGRTACAAYTTDAIQSMLVKSGEDKGSESLAAKLRACVVTTQHREFARAYPCAVRVKCPGGCDTELSVAPQEAVEDGGDHQQHPALFRPFAWVAVHPPCMASARAAGVCTTCKAVVPLHPDVTGARAEALPLPSFPPTGFLGVRSRYTCHACTPLPTLRGVVAAVKAVGGGGGGGGVMTGSGLPPLHLVRGVCKRVTGSDVDRPYFQWVRAAVKPQVLAALRAVDASLPPDGYQLEIVLDAACLDRTFEAFVRDDAALRRVVAVSRPYLDYMYETAMKQRCPGCGKDGTKDDMCTHISCCAMWCYGCGQALQDKVAHTCPFGLHMEEGRGPEGTICASSAAAAVRMFHVGKLVDVLWDWLCRVGVVRGVVLLRAHEQLGPCWVEYGHLLFVVYDVLRQWLQAMHRTLPRHKFVGIFGFDVDGLEAFVV